MNKLTKKKKYKKTDEITKIFSKVPEYNKNERDEVWLGMFGL